MMSPVSMAMTTPAAESKVASVPAASHKVAPKASVIIVNYNGQEYLERCLRSLLNEGAKTPSSSW
jgi:hypothetical protein